MLSQLDGTSAFLQLNEPAPAVQILMTVKTMGLLAGVLVPITARSIRNGSARDIAYLSKSLPGTEHRAVALGLGHDEVSVVRGVTANYIGPLETLMYNMRAQNPHVDRLAPQFAAEPFQIKRLKKHEIDEYMTREDMDLTDPASRQRAAVAMKKDAVETWRDREKERAVPEPVAKRPRLFSASTSDSSMMTNSPAPSASSTSSLSCRSSPDARAHDKPTGPFSDEENLIQERLLQDKTTTTAQVDAMSCDESKIDDLLSMVEHSGQDVNTGDGDKPKREEIDATDREIEKLLSSQDLIDGSPINLPGDQFVTYFATINIFRNLAEFDHSSDEDIALHVPTGNSRNKPEPFLFYCCMGCGHSSWSPIWMSAHEVNCDGVRVEEADTPFACPELGCEKAYDTSQKLQRHIGDVHEWTPSNARFVPIQMTKSSLVPSLSTRNTGTEFMTSCQSRPSAPSSTYVM